jgi:hypothetical protein
MHPIVVRPTGDGRGDLARCFTDSDVQGSETWEELISERVFGQEIPPRWILAVSRDQLLLIKRQKWAAVCVCDSGMYWPTNNSTLTPSRFSGSQGSPCRRFKAS